MRDILLALIIVPGGLMALRYPFLGAMLWTWVSVMNPHRLAWNFMRNSPIGMYLALCTLVGLLFTKEKRSPFVAPPVVWLVVLMTWMCVTTMFAFNTADSLVQLEKVLKIDLMVLVTLMLVRTKREMIMFAWVLAFSVAFFGIKGGIFTIATGGSFRVWGPSGSYIEENNALALALIVTIPLMRFLQTTLAEKWQKNAMTAAMVLCGISAIGSQSRGALLAISAMALLLWWRGKNKFQTGLILVLVGVAILSFMPQEWWDRMATIQTYQEDRSAMGRINAWHMAWNLAKHNFFGGGFSIYNAHVYSLYAPDPTFVVSAHSIYFTMIGEHGFVGLLIYIGLWWSTWNSAAWLRKQGLAHPDAAWCSDLGGMAQVSLVGFAVGGAFLSLAYFDYTYNLMALVAAARFWVHSRGWETDPAPVPTRKFFGIPLFYGDRLNGRTPQRSAVEQT